MFFKPPVHCVEHRMLLCCPQRCNEDTLWTVSGKPVNHCFTGNDFERMRNDTEIFLHFHASEFTAAVLECKICSFEHMKHGDFYTVCSGSNTVTDCSKHIILCLARKPENHVCYDMNRTVCVVYTLYGIVVDAVAVSASDVLHCFSL